jgi:hypothetical protein
MALVANNVYAYTSADDEQIFVKGSDLTDLGDWSSAITYSFRQVVSYLGAYYVCLLANTNTPPSGNISDEWSVLVLVREGDPGGHTADEAYALAEEALETAVEVGQQGSQYAFDLYVAGTNFTNDVAVAAIGTAIQQGSEFAYNLFIQGTNYTNTAAVAAVQVAAQEGSQFATILHDAGTNYTDQQIAIAVFNVGNSGSDFAIILRDQGTNYTNSQVAAEALARVNGDTAVFVNSSQFTTQQVNIESAQRIHDDGTVASNGSAYSYLLYEGGTNYAQTLVEIEAAIRAANDFSFYVAGTNYTNQQVIATQVAAGSESLALFYAGTAYTDLRVNHEAGQRMTGDQALQVWVGTNRDMIEDLAAILGASFNGTFSLYMAQVARGQPDTKITVVGGVVTGFEQSPYIWEDWARYDAGPAPSSFNKGSSWSDESYGSITTEVFAGTVAQDGIQTYADGTIQLLNDGVGFNVTGTFAQPFSTQLGVDAFDYSLGTIVNPDMNGGSTWFSPAVIFQY